MLTRGDILTNGTTERQLRRLIAGGELVRLRPGYFVLATHWKALFAEDRHLLQVLAADAARRDGEVVFALASAAVLHRLPLFRIAPEHVHVMGPRTDAVARPKAGLAHHCVALTENDMVTLDGAPCTSLSRTVFDLTRTLSREAAVALADAAFRQVGWDAEARRFDSVAAEAFRGQLIDRISLSPGARGIRQARWIAEFADGRAQLPGESVSRLHLVDLGFAVPRLQVPFPGPKGEPWAIDFGLDDVGAWGEFDGVGKYTDPSMLQGRSSQDAVLAEKFREDWIRGRSQRKFGRWGNPHIASARTLGERLAAFHIYPPSR
jgi:hypothetical protein